MKVITKRHGTLVGILVERTERMLVVLVGQNHIRYIPMNRINSGRYAVVGA